MAERLRALFLYHSIISPLCLVLVRAPHWSHVRQAKFWSHVRQAKFCLRVCQVVFLGFSRFRLPQLMIGASHMRGNNIERDVKLNLKKKKKISNLPYPAGTYASLVGDKMFTLTKYRRPPITVQLISAFVFATRIEQFLFFLIKSVKVKLLAIFYSCTGRFVSEQVRSETGKTVFLMLRLK